MFAHLLQNISGFEAACLNQQSDYTLHASKLLFIIGMMAVPSSLCLMGYDFFR